MYIQRLASYTDTLEVFTSETLDEVIRGSRDRLSVLCIICVCMRQYTHIYTGTLMRRPIPYGTYLEVSYLSPGCALYHALDIS